MDQQKRRKLDNGRNDLSPKSGGSSVEWETSDGKFAISDRNFVLVGDKVVYPSNVPTKPDTNLRWIERIGTFYQPHASFIYEIIYQYTYKEPGFEYQWQYLPYAGHCLNRWMLYCVVSAVTPSFSNVVSVGDIVVKMNDESLLYKPGDKVEFPGLGTKLHDSLKSLKNPITLRFFRISGHTNNTLPSPAELGAVTFDKGTMHRFLVKVNIRGETSTVVLEASSTDPQAPASIKKSIQGIKLQWQLTPNLPAAPLNANYQVNLQTTYSNPTANIAIGVVVDYEPKEGICKEGKKFNVYVTDRGNGTNALYLLGSFDKEEEANRFHAKILQSERISGKFNLRHYLLNFKAPSDNTPSLISESELSVGAALNSSAPIDYTSILG